jgi:excisionase family DNA binding protein
MEFAKMNAAIAETPVGRILTTLPPRECAALPINTAADYLGVGRTTIYELLKQGLIRSIRVRSRNLILRSSLDDYVKSLSAYSSPGNRRPIPFVPCGHSAGHNVMEKITWF